MLNGNAFDVQVKNRQFLVPTSLFLNSNDMVLIKQP